MTTETKNKDYSASAVNLCNPLEVKQALDSLHFYQMEMEKLKEQIKAAIPELIEKGDSLDRDIAANISEIKTLIQQYGSYQDTEAGEYALIYEAKTAQYDAEAFEARYPNLAPVVLTKEVNVEALKGLIKGELLSREALESPPQGLPPVITYKISQRTVIQ